MKYFISTLIIMSISIINYTSIQAQILDFSKVKIFEHQLDDVMEIIDTNEVKIKLQVEEENYKQNPTEINKVRLGIIYHETALNFSFLSKTEFKGYAKKSFDILSELYNTSTTIKELLPFIASYRASALSLVGAETKKLKLLGHAFTLFEDAVSKYADISYMPEFLRGSVAENLPWYFYSKRKCAKLDFQSIINKNEKNKDYANWKIMSFTYWAWANQRQSKQYKTMALSYIEKSIDLDPTYKAGRKRAEALKIKMMK